MGAFGLEITVVNRCFLVKGGFGGGGSTGRIARLFLMFLSLNK